MFPKICRAFVFVLFFASLSALSAQEIAVGRYRVPSLPGWKRMTRAWPARHIHFRSKGRNYDYLKGYEKEVTLTRTYDGITATLQLDMQAYSKIVTPQEITAGRKLAVKVMGMMPGLQETVLQSRPTHFGGHYAYFQHTRGPAYQSRETVDYETLTILDGRQIYTLSRTIRGLTLPPQTMTRIEKDWRAFQKQIAASRS